MQLVIYVKNGVRHARFFTTLKTLNFDIKVLGEHRLIKYLAPNTQEYSKILHNHSTKRKSYILQLTVHIFTFKDIKILQKSHLDRGDVHVTGKEQVTPSKVKELKKRILAIIQST